MPLRIKTSVTEGKEPLPLPAKLCHLKCSLGLFVKEHLQLCEFFFSGQPDIIAEAFYLLLELGQ